LCWLLFFWHVEITYLSLSISKIFFGFPKNKKFLSNETILVEWGFHQNAWNVLHNHY
jgi:hypothetical protein